MISCPGCGNAVPDGSRTCPKCNRVFGQSPLKGAGGIALGCFVAFLLFAAYIGGSVYLDTRRENAMSPGERQRQLASAIREITDYTDGLGRAYTSIAEKTPEDIGRVHCQSAEVSPATPPELRPMLVYGPFLKRFTDRGHPWTADQTPWSFVTDSALSGHFEKNPAERERYAVLDTAKRVQDTFRKVRYLLVLWPDPAADNRLPERTNGSLGPTLYAGEQYTPGEFHGWLLNVDETNGSLLCASRIDVHSSKEIYHRHNDLYPSPLHTRMVVYHPEKDAASEIRADFERRLQEAIVANAPGGVKPQMSFGPIF